MTLGDLLRAKIAEQAKQADLDRAAALSWWRSLSTDQKMFWYESFSNEGTVIPFEAFTASSQRIEALWRKVQRGFSL
jgi:hypothetical protein